MKTIGEQAKEFRLAKGWNTTRMAKEVETSRQNIENLEEKGDSKPRYIVKLARVMGTTVDDLMNGTVGSIPINAAAPQPNTASASSQSQLQGTFDDAVRVIAQHLQGVDIPTSEMVMSVLARMAQHPEEHERIGRAASAVLASGKRRAA